MLGLRGWKMILQKARQAALAVSKMAASRSLAGAGETKNLVWMLTFGECQDFWRRIGCSRYRMMGKSPRLSTIPKTALCGESARELGHASDSRFVSISGIPAKLPQKRQFLKNIFFSLERTVDTACKDRTQFIGLPEPTVSRGPADAKRGKHLGHKAEKFPVATGCAAY